MPRYGFGARFYDVLSGERAVYQAGRVLGISRLGLRAGARALDVGCGTGLNLPLLVDRVGPQGAVVGVDASDAMLAQARARVARQGWRNVEVRRGDAGRLAEVTDGAAPFDAVLFTYSLSIIGEWQAAFDQALALLRPGGRIVVVDLALPRGRWRIFWPLARLACFTGGVDPYRAPWQRLLEMTDDTSHAVLRGGHIHVAAGTRTVG